MPDVPVLSAHTVFNTDIVSLFDQLCDICPKLFLILLQYGGRNHMKAVFHHLFLRFVAQYLQSRSVDTDDVCPIHCMAHHTAVHGGKDRLQGMILLYNLLLIGPLLGHINRHAHGPHNTAVQIIQGRLISRKQPYPVAGLHRFLRDKGSLVCHNLLLRFNAGRIILLNIPDIGMSAPFYLLLCLINRLTKAVIHLLMNAILILIPDKIRHMIDGCFQKLAGLPGILLPLAGLLPPQKPETDLLIRHRHDPDIPDL